MNIIFNRKAGEIASIIHSLSYANNIDELIDILENDNISMDEDFKEDLYSIKSKLKLMAYDLDFFFGRESMIWKSFVSTTRLWKNNNVQDFLNDIAKLGHITIKKRLYTKLRRENNQDMNYEGKEIIKDNQRFFYYIKSLRIDEKEKWNLLCFIEDIDLYIKKFIELIEAYLPIYNDLYKRYEDEKTLLCNRIEANINDEGIEYIKKIIGGYVEVKDYREIHATVSIFNNYKLNFAIKDNKLYLYIGLRYEESMKSNLRFNEGEQALLVFKNIAEKTRFDIVKFLLTGEHFGQEIAEKLQISTAAVSYQMNYLFAANLVKIKKVDRKIYYILNKDTIRESIEFLERELEL